MALNSTQKSLLKEIEKLLRELNRTIYSDDDQFILVTKAEAGLV